MFELAKCAKNVLDAEEITHSPLSKRNPNPSIKLASTLWDLFPEHPMENVT